MSVDLVAVLGKPVTLDAVLRSGHQVVAELLGGVAAPDLLLFADRRYHEGKRNSAGRRLTTAELKTTTVGDHVPAGADRTAAAAHVEIDVPTTGDGVFLIVTDYQGDDLHDGRHVVFTPYRTCVAVTLAVSLALATARLADGRYVDEQIHMVAPTDNDRRETAPGVKNTPSGTARPAWLTHPGWPSGPRKAAEVECATLTSLGLEVTYADDQIPGTEKGAGVAELASHQVIVSRPPRRARLSAA